VLKLDVRQIRILDELFKQEFVDAKQFMTDLFISVRTLQIEIKIINDELAHNNYPFEIANFRGRGYYLDYKESKHEMVKIVMKQCVDYLENSQLFAYGNSSRVFSIGRLLLVAKSYIKSYDIGSYLHISDATFTNDMKLVRKALNHHGITLISTPHYGMKISGDELSIRNCMIDFCDVYNFEEELPIFYEVSLDEYGFTREELRANGELLKKSFKQHDMRVSDVSFRRLAIYLSILRNRIGINEIVIDENDFVGLKELAIARDILAQLKITDYQEVLSFCCFLVVECHNDHKLNKENYPNLYLQVENDFLGLNQSLKQVISLDLTQYEGVKSKLEIFLLKRFLKKKYNLITHSICNSVYEMFLRLPASYALTKQILFILNDYHIEKDEALISELFMVIHNTVFVIPNKYKAINVLLINRFGQLNIESFKYRLRQDNHNLNYHFKSVHELQDIDWQQYACAILIKPTTIDVSKCPIPLFEYHYFANSREIETLRSQIIMKQHRDNLVFPQLSQFDISNNVIRKPEEICELLIQAGLEFVNLYEYLIEEISSNVHFGVGGKRLITIHSNSEMKARVFRFRFKEAQIINNEEIEEIQVFVLNLQSNILTIKQGDSVLRRILNNEVEINGETSL